MNPNSQNETQAHATAYKFCGCHGLTILKNLELKVTPPNEFNDPFEFTPDVYCSDWGVFVARNREAILKGVYGSEFSRGQFNGTFEEFSDSPECEQKIQCFVKALGRGANEYEKQFLDLISSRFLVLCMASRRDSVLMWGHYCSSTNGLVIGFDTACLPFCSGQMLKRVRYVKRKLQLDACWEKGSRRMERFEQAIIFSKAEEWRYESELRQILPVSSPLVTARKVIDKKRGGAFKGYFLPFSPEAVVSVTVGPRCSDEFEEQVCSILGDSRFSRVKLERAVLKKGRFSVSFESIRRR